MLSVPPTSTLIHTLVPYPSRFRSYNSSLIGFFGFGRDPNGPPYNAAGSSRTGVAGCYTTTGEILRDNPGGTLLPATVEGGHCTNLAAAVGDRKSVGRGKGG